MSTNPAVTTGALYYPYVRPPQAWLKRSLLLFDRTASILPTDDVDLDDIEMAWLADEGAWEPMYVSSLSDESYLAEVEEALLTFADKPEYRFGRDYPAPHLVDRLFFGKLQPSVEGALVELGLAKSAKFAYLMVHREVLTVLLAVTAKYLAAQRSSVNERLIPSTDQRASAVYALQPKAGSIDLARSIGLMLAGLVPTPGPDSSFQDIIMFRQRHEMSVRRFRQALHGLSDRVAGSNDPIETIRRSREEIEDALLDLADSAQQRRMRLAFSSSALVLVTTALPQLVEWSTIHWTFDGLGLTMTIGAYEYWTRHRLRQDARGAFAYLHDAAVEFSGRSPR